MGIQGGEIRWETSARPAMASRGSLGSAGGSLGSFSTQGSVASGSLGSSAAVASGPSGTSAAVAPGPRGMSAAAASGSRGMSAAAAPGPRGTSAAGASGSRGTSAIPTGSSATKSGRQHGAKAPSRNGGALKKKDEPVLIVNLEVPGGGVGTVELEQGSDVGEAARVFCATHGLPEVMVGAMEGYLGRELSKVLAKKEKQRREESRWHTTGAVDDKTYLLRTPGFNEEERGRGHTGSSGRGASSGGIHDRMYKEAVAKQRGAAARKRDQEEEEEREMREMREELREQLRRNERVKNRRGEREGYEVINRRHGGGVERLYHEGVVRKKVVEERRERERQRAEMEEIREATFSPEISARARRLERSNGEVLDPLGRVRRELALAAAELREAELSANKEETFRPRINSRSRDMDPGRTSRDPLPRHERLYVEAMQRQQRREGYVETSGSSPGGSGTSASSSRPRVVVEAPSGGSEKADRGLDFYERVVEGQRRKDAELALLRELRDASLEVDEETGQKLYHPATGASRHYQAKRSSKSGGGQEAKGGRRRSLDDQTAEKDRAVVASKESQLLVRRRMVRSLQAMHAGLVARQQAMGVVVEAEGGEERVDFGNEDVLRAELSPDEYTEVLKAVEGGSSKGADMCLSSKAFVTVVRSWLERPESGTMSSRGHVLLGRGQLVARGDVAGEGETFSPRISEVSEKLVRDKGEGGFHARQANAAAREQAWLEDQRRAKERQELEGCTFRPEINPQSEVMVRKLQQVEAEGGGAARAPLPTEAVYTQVAALIDERAEETGADPAATPAPGTVAEIEHLIRAQVAERAAQPSAS